MRLIAENNSLNQATPLAAVLAAGGTWAFVKGESANPTNELGVGRVIL